MGYASVEERLNNTSAAKERGVSRKQLSEVVNDIAGKQEHLQPRPARKPQKRGS